MVVFIFKFLDTVCLFRTYDLDILPQRIRKLNILLLIDVRWRDLNSKNDIV